MSLNHPSPCCISTPLFFFFPFPYIHTALHVISFGLLSPMPPACLSMHSLSHFSFLSPPNRSQQLPAALWARFYHRYIPIKREIFLSTITKCFRNCWGLPFNITGLIYFTIQSTLRQLLLSTAVSKNTEKASKLWGGGWVDKRGKKWTTENIYRAMEGMQKWCWCTASEPTGHFYICMYI